MADVDEEAMPGLRPVDDTEIDLSEEVQDFRFLQTAKGNDAKIPKRGEKDFEPHATALQSNTLAASREAMHNALSFQRVHAPKTNNPATYHPESNMAYAHNPKGPLFARMGRILPKNEDPIGDDELRGMRMWFLPEEIIYLVERGTIDLRWPASEDDEDGEGLPMSLQACYAMFIGEEANRGGALTFERYHVYSGLKRAGYIVLRAEDWKIPARQLTAEHYAPSPPRSWQPGLFTLARIKQLFLGDPKDGGARFGSKTLLAPGLYRDYAQIYRRLAVIQWHDPTIVAAPEGTTSAASDPDFRLTYDVWKPGNTTFKKSDPGTPDFRIAVVNARGTNVPSLQQISSLLETTPYDPPKPDGQLYQKLKHGYKNVILAVVDQGVISYLRISDAAFGREKLYERKGKMPGGKRGGGGGKGGRGGRGGRR